jgi:hypothetical protein
VSAAQAVGEPLQALLLALSLGMTCGNSGPGNRIFARGLFVRAKRRAGWQNPFGEKVKCSDLLRYLRYFAAVLAAREALTNSGKGLWPAETRSG